MTSASGPSTMVCVVIAKKRNEIFKIVSSLSIGLARLW